MSYLCSLVSQDMWFLWLVIPCSLHIPLLTDGWDNVRLTPPPFNEQKQGGYKGAFMPLDSAARCLHVCTEPLLLISRTFRLSRHPALTWHGWFLQTKDVCGILKLDMWHTCWCWNYCIIVMLFVTHHDTFQNDHTWSLEAENVPVPWWRPVHRLSLLLIMWSHVNTCELCTALVEEWDKSFAACDRDFVM